MVCDGPSCSTTSSAPCLYCLAYWWARTQRHCRARDNTRHRLRAPYADPAPQRTEPKPCENLRRRGVCDLRRSAAPGADKQTDGRPTQSLLREAAISVCVGRLVLFIHRMPGTRYAAHRHGPVLEVSQNAHVFRKICSNFSSLNTGYCVDRLLSVSLLAIECSRCQPDLSNSFLHWLVL